MTRRRAHGSPRAALLAGVLTAAAALALPAPVLPAPVRAAVLAAPAAPPGDEWSIERSDRAPELVEQRFTKLRREPFDAAQWRALEAALGRPSLARRIESALARDPRDPALTILQARMDVLQGHPREAADRLAPLTAANARPGPWSARIAALQVDALLAAGDPRGAITALEARAAADPRALERAHAIASQSQLDREALRLARRLADLAPGSADAQLRLARAAAAVDDSATAEAAFAAAERASTPGARPRIRRERAQAQLRAGAIAPAADLIWSALAEPATPAAEREPLWAALAECHARDTQGALDVARLERWLAEPRHQGEAAAWRTLARIQTSLGLDPTAAWRRAVALAPRDPESQAALLVAIDAAGDNEATLAEFRRLGGGRTPERAQQGLALASRMIGNGHRDLGLALAAEIEAVAGKNPGILLALLDFYNLSDEADRALAVAEALVKAHPRDPEARIALGEQFFQMRRESDALREWGKLPTLIRPAHRGWARHAEILAEHRHPEAIVSLEKALAAAPREPSYLRLRAILMQDSRVPQRALTSWQELLAAAKGPQNRLLRDEARTRVVDLLVGGSFGKQSARRQSAEKEALAALQSPDRETAREAALFLAELYTREERHDEAVAIQELLLKAEPDDPERLAALALALRRAGRSDEAMAALERLVAVDPRRSSDVLAELAELAFEAGDQGRALAAAARVADAGADPSRAYVRLGELHERRGDTDEAARTYARALEAAPKDALARIRLAELTLARGQESEAAALFRAIVEDGGPPELVQQAGRRALDLAEARGNTAAIVELALARGRREPLADEPRELLLDALDRSSAAELRAWIGPRSAPAGQEREAALRRALVHALTRDAIGMRLRAADHLGRLDLPGAAVPLARMGAQLSPPRDAPRTVRDAYVQARAAALYAAGRLDEPEALPLFEQVLRAAPAGDVRHAAAWAIAQSSDPRARPILAGLIADRRDPQLSALACLALARAARPDPALHKTVVDRARGRTRHEGHACALAASVLAPAGDPAPTIAALASSDPVLAAIAAWRLAQGDPSPPVVEALLGRYLGPPGLARDAAASALARLLGAAAPPSLGELPQLHGRGWETTLERWLVEVTARPPEPIPASALAPHHGALARALAAAEAGTRAEREALARVDGPCAPAPAKSTARQLCLAPLVRGTITLDDGPRAR